MFHQEIVQKLIYYFNYLLCIQDTGKKKNKPVKIHFDTEAILSLDYKYMLVTAKTLSKEKSAIIHICDKM